MKITLLIFCFCLFFSVNVCALEAIDLENASIMELEAFISMADQAESVLQEEKNHHTAEDMCEIAIEELKKCWAEDEFFINETTGYFQIIHTRVIYLYPSFENASGIKEQEKLLEICRKIFSNENGSPMIAFVECALLTDCYGTAPYYVNNNMDNCVAFYQDGTMAVCSKSPIEMYRSTTYTTEFIGIIREIKDKGSQYNEVCYLK